MVPIIIIFIEIIIELNLPQVQNLLSMERS